MNYISASRRIFEKPNFIQFDIEAWPTPTPQLVYPARAQMVSGTGKDIFYWIFYVPERPRSDQYQSVDSSTTRDVSPLWRVGIRVFLETARLRSV